MIKQILTLQEIEDLNPKGHFQTQASCLNTITRGPIKSIKVDTSRENLRIQLHWIAQASIPRGSKAVKWAIHRPDEVSLLISSFLMPFYTEPAAEGGIRIRFGESGVIYVVPQPQSDRAICDALGLG